MTAHDALLLLIGCMAAVSGGAVILFIRGYIEATRHARRLSKPRVRTEIIWRQ